jgi:hypothetical protein
MARPPRRRRSAVERRLDRDGAPIPAPAVRAEMLRRQRGLAERVASYMRDKHPGAGLTVGALLLVSATGALAYDVVAEETEQVQLVPVTPLTAEVRSDLPSTPGRYRVDPDSVTRDARGLYRFSWVEPQLGGASHPASVSLLKLAETEDVDELEVPAQGDPILYLRQSTPVRIIAESAPYAGSTNYYGSHYVYINDWYPYYGSGYTRGPVYRSPPVEGQATSAPYRGSVESTAPRPASARTISVPSRADAVSGQASGTGGGTAVSRKSGLGTSSTSSSVSAPRSSSFSTGGRAGGSVGGGSSGGSSSSAS